MNENEIVSSAINFAEGETLNKTYAAVATKETFLKKLITTLLLSITAVMFIVCFGIVVFGGDAKTGAFKYDSVSYWVIISSIIVAYVVLMITALVVALVYNYLKTSSAKVAVRSIRIALTTRRIVVVNIENLSIVNEINLADLEDVKRYVDDQVKLITYSGKDYVIKVDDPLDFHERYPGLVRSEKQRVKHLAD